MKYNNLKTAFDKFFPLPLIAIMWLLIVFVVSVIVNGLEFSVEYLLFISVFLFNGAMIATVINHFLYKEDSRTNLIKIVISASCCILLSTILLIFTSWEYLVAFFLLPLPFVIGIYFLYKKKGAKK